MAVVQQSSTEVWLFMHVTGMEMFGGSAEVEHPVCFNVIISFWLEATQHLIRKGSFHCDRLILNNIITKTDLNAPRRTLVIRNIVSEVTRCGPALLRETSLVYISGGEIR